MACPHPDQKVPVSTTTRPVTQTADVAVKRGQEVGPLPRRREGSQEEQCTRQDNASKTQNQKLRR
jgi:hypothetical protein